MSVQHRSWAEISLAQIASNYKAIRTVVGPDVQIAPVVKADAYRHGAVQVSRTLEREGVRWLSVANVEEGITLREAGIATRILVLAGFFPQDRKDLAEFHLTPVLHGLQEVRDWNSFARDREQPLRYHLKIDTGMGRLGTRAGAGELIETIRENGWARLEGLMTHLASPADYESPQTGDQLGAFASVRSDLRAAGIEPLYVHASSTAPIAYGNEAAWGNMVRPGLSIYGYLPGAKGDAPERVLEVRPALSWKASVLRVKDVPEGALIGYGGSFRAERPLRIAVIAAGYADGVPHQVSNRGQVIAGGKIARILGAVSMDLTTIDISATPELVPGDSVMLIGSEGSVKIDADDIARTTGTISYSVLCGIHARVQRVYV